MAASSSVATASPLALPIAPIFQDEEIDSLSQEIQVRIEC